MYAKIFSQIYDGTLCTVGPWEALVTFQQFLVLADMDGVVDMTAGAISRRTSIPIEIIEKGIAVLARPDPESRTPDEEGRRLVLLSEPRTWGWRVVNYKHYRKLVREEDRRAYHHDRYESKKAVKVSNSVNKKNRQIEQTSTAVDSFNTSQQFQAIQPIAYAEAKADAEAVRATEAGASVVAAEIPDGAAPSRKIPDCPQTAIIKLYNEILPTAAPVKAWSNANEAALRTRWKETCLRLGYAAEADGLDWFRKLFVAISESDFLMGRKYSNGKEPFYLRLAWIVNAANFAKIIEGSYWRRET